MGNFGQEMVNPICNGDYILVTPEVNRLYNIVRRLHLGNSRDITISVILGKSGAGKTSALRYVTAKLEENGIPTVSVTERDDGRIIRSELLNSILCSTRPEVTRPNDRNMNIYERRLRLIQNEIPRFGDEPKRVLLILDDAHRIQEDQLCIFFELYNSLLASGIKLGLILVTVHKRESMFPLDIACRLSYEHFRCPMVSEMQTYLSLYDTVDWNGTSFTEYFFTHDQGFRLASCAQDVMSVLCAMGLHLGSPVPMSYFTTWVQYVFRTFGITGYGVNTITADHWREAIKSSGFHPDISKDVEM